MADRLLQANELSFISGQLHVAWRERTTKECDRASALVDDRTEAGARRVAVHDEQLLEVLQLEDRGREQRLFKGGERGHSCLGP